MKHEYVGGKKQPKMFGWIALHAVKSDCRLEIACLLCHVPKGLGHGGGCHGRRIAEAARP